MMHRLADASWHVFHPYNSTDQGLHRKFPTILGTSMEIAWSEALTDSLSPCNSDMTWNSELEIFDIVSRYTYSPISTLQIVRYSRHDPLFLEIDFIEVLGYWTRRSQGLSFPVHNGRCGTDDNIPLISWNIAVTSNLHIAIVCCYLWGYRDSSYGRHRKSLTGPLHHDWLCGWTWYW